MRTFHLQWMLGGNDVSTWWVAKEMCSGKHSSRSSTDTAEFLAPWTPSTVKAENNRYLLCQPPCTAETKGKASAEASEKTVFFLMKRREIHRERSVLSPASFLSEVRVM